MAERHEKGPPKTPGRPWRAFLQIRSRQTSPLTLRERGVRSGEPAR
ncbi:putative transglycosylase [Pseudomonas aeruginosa]|nr:putative transglycosylase [Pseudomonas aeruginosa]GAA18013.1 probable transglycosylase [Pseudomonas aeruginosa NCMG1179]AWF00389.1 putative transglycosylase [Pseudomonas aeruginosa]RAL82973.1 putative transglycosylase [Pseudomonas aeruginosa]RCG88528.1 putative transglycosylase [Pseudomonas aeruginosa]